MINIPALVAKRLRLSTVALQSVRSYAGYWNKDWRPGPVPETEQERRAAAKKYGLIPEDYQTYPDDGAGYGDYPKLPIISAESRDPHINYDMDEFKRNYGEPLHVDADMYGEDRWDYNRKLPFTLVQMNVIFLSVIGTIAFLIWCGEQVKICYVKRMPKHNPMDGKKHYSFELVEDKSC